MLSLTAEEIAATLGIGVHTFYDWIDILAIESEVNENGDALYSSSSVDTLLEYKQQRVSTELNTNAFSMINNSCVQGDLLPVAQFFVAELEKYSDRAFEAEKQLYVLEEKKQKLEQDCMKLNEELLILKEELEDKKQKLVEFDGYKKKLSLLKAQVKLWKLQEKRKKIWQFWK